MSDNTSNRPTPTTTQVPFRLAAEAGKEYWWCACGRSKGQPFCDGSHHGTSTTPLAFNVEESLTVALCGCKLTERPPYCDGSHARPRKK